MLLSSKVESFYPKIKTSNEICFVANILYVHTQFKDLFNAFDLQTNNVTLIAYFPLTDIHYLFLVTR